jgi:hypothetical protein
MKVKTRKCAKPRSGESLSDSGDEFLPRARGRLGWLGPTAWLGTGGASFVLLATGFFVLYPLALLVYGSFVVTRADGGTGLGLDAWLSAWHQAGMVQSVVDTATRTLATEIISLPLAIGAPTCRASG